MWCARRKLRTFPLMGLRHAERIGEVAMEAETILEYGSGGSTLWLAQIAPDAHIVTVEHNERWSWRVSKAIGGLAELGIAVSAKIIVRYRPDLADYPLTGGLEAFDMILVDGVHETRDACLRSAFDMLNPGGTVFLHDAEEPDYQPGIQAFIDGGGIEIEQYGPDPTYDGPAHLWEGQRPC